MRRRTLLGSGLGLLASLPATRPAMAGDPEALVYSWPSNVGPLNPHLYAPNQMFAQGMVYEPLVRYAEGGAIEPALALSWSVSDDGRSYTFDLRPGVKFSDGTAFDAAAVKANFDTILKNANRHAFLELVAQIDAVEVIDALTVRLNLKNAYFPTLNELSLVRPIRFLAPSAFPPNGDTASGIRAPIGTGPWKLVESLRGERDEFVRNEHYWGARPRMERITVKVVPDPNSRALALEIGEIDLVHGTDQIGSEAFRRFQADPRFVTAISQPVASRVLAINSNLVPTSDLRVRQAVLHAVNRASLVKNVLLGLERPAEALFSPTFPYADVGLEVVPFDRARAMALLEEAGWQLPAGGVIRARDGAELAVELCFTGTDALQKAIAEAVQSDLRKVGIAVRLTGEEESAFEARQRSGAFGMIFGDTWGAPYDPPSFMSSMRAPSHGDYQAQLGLPMKALIDQRIKEALLSTSEEQRGQDYAWLLRTLHEQAVYLPISYTTVMMAHRKDLTGAGFGVTKNEIPFAAMAKTAG
jgi:nickel transport system substrate-binding protein